MRCALLTGLVCWFSLAQVLPAQEPAEPPTLSVEELAAGAKKSVVEISYNGRDGRRAGLGTGFVISKDGLIATNLHVIGEARPIQVKFMDGKTFPVVSIHATDRNHDLALLKIDADNLPALPLGDSRELKQGEEIVALGNPLGLQYSVVSGVVSGQRLVEETPMFQLAIPIESGNSGGPLLDRQGRVHGILTLKSLVTRNLGFAVTINTLKPLIEKPNPVPMSRWLTIGQLNPKQWTPLFGAHWQQRAGRIQVSGQGGGFGGRSLCLSEIAAPEMPYELGVFVKLDDDAGAAGLVFHADGENQHYGFYPSNGGLRLSRFDGADVFSWQVLSNVESDHYKPGEWNYLKVHVEMNKLQCYVNDHLVIESRDSQFVKGKIGLAKFRETEAEFKGFQVAKTLPSMQPTPEFIEQVTGLVQGIPVNQPPAYKLADALPDDAVKTNQTLRQRARELERQAARLRELAELVHQQGVLKRLAELSRQEEQIDLLEAALLIARLDNEELEVEPYLAQVKQMAEEIAAGLPKDADDVAKLKALNKYLFEEQGYHGSRTDYYNSANSYLNEVIDDREGLPITLSVLYLELAERLNVNVVGVGLPGHFVVRHEPKAGPTQLIDVFNGGKFITRDEAEQLVLDYTGRDVFDEQHLVTQTRRQIVERMLSNLMNNAKEKQDAEVMLRYVQGLVAVDAESGAHRWYRAILYFQTSRLEDALQDIAWLQRIRPPEVEPERVDELENLIRRQLNPAETDDNN